MKSVPEKNFALIQACFPEVYFTCHSRNAGSAGNHGLTPRDGTPLAHMAGLDGIETGKLDRHLGRAKSNLFATLKKLEAYGLIALERPGRDSRRRLLRITPAGRECISQTSVLVTDRLAAILASTPGQDQQAEVNGLQLPVALIHQKEIAKRQSIWTTALLLAVVVALVFAIGAMLSRNHSVERGVSVPAAPEIVYERLADFACCPLWITGFQRVTIEPGGRFHTEVHSISGNSAVNETRRPPKGNSRTATCRLPTAPVTRSRKRSLATVAAK